MAGLVPAISIGMAKCPFVEIAGTKPGDDTRTYRKPLQRLTIT
jgi:hypothetical protein